MTDLRKFFIGALVALPIGAAARNIEEGYIDWGTRGSGFPKALQNWNKGDKWSEDDNFFISRVRPKTRFRNQATQVDMSLGEDNDKKLIFWVPVNNQDFNALPDGRYDSEVFPMWQYVTHYGNWSTQLVRMPGNFADAAHRNGVPVSVVASVPYGSISAEWNDALTVLSGTSPEKLADFLEYYGVDGIGYNSEFVASSSLVSALSGLHSEVVKLLKGSGRMPLTEFIWYDGTNERGSVSFDRGLGTHNDDLWGYGDDIKTALFFNYNWNYTSTLENTVTHAARLGRTPLDLYCGINMQGREPKYPGNGIWTLLRDYPLSIGLWGAHSQNMFFESRAEKGPKADTRQRSYMLRMEKWFTGGDRNPVSSIEVNNSLICSADNDGFFGMSKLMSARSSLKWDLGEEPFMSYFNLGNGRFFNFKGQRCHDAEWYNIGMQDYLPTWRWWFSGKFLGRNPVDVPVGGLDAEFVWDDAWMGGSTVRIHGSAADEYLHLFKTEFALRTGDVITFRYKVVSGSADLSLALSVKGAEQTIVSEDCLKVLGKSADTSGVWQERRFVVGEDVPGLDGKDLAMVALHFSGADALDMRLGEFSIVRGTATSVTPQRPVIEKAEILSSCHDGADAKIIFNMPNDKGDEVCYNTDVHTSLFKLYARQQGREPVLMGMTSSWAGLMYSIPVEYTAGASVSLGVSALSLDMSSESEIAWSGYMPLADKYELADDIVVSQPVINPGEPFEISYADPEHEPADWTLLSADGQVVAKSEGTAGIDFPEGLGNAGYYDLVVDGFVHENGSAVETRRELKAFVQITPESTGTTPKIVAFAANGTEEDLYLSDPVDREVTLTYECRPGEGAVSRGVKVGDSGIGFRAEDAGIDGSSPFSVSFWFKPESFDDTALHLFSIRDKGDKWANNNWGWFWHTLNPDGTTSEFTLRMASGGNASYRFDDTRLTPGVWHHFVYVFDVDSDTRVKPSLYVDGKLQKVTSWSRGDVNYDTDPTPQGRAYDWLQDNVVAIGGYLHNNGSVVGNIDNLMLWDKALSEEDVAVAMGDVQHSGIPAGLAACFGFDDAPGADFTFAGQGEREFRAGAHDYAPTEIEGQGKLYWKEAEFCTGAPTLAGDEMKVKAKVEFIGSGTRITGVEGDAERGSAVFAIPSDGVYELGVRISNDYGSDERCVKVYVGDTGLDMVEDGSALSVSPNPFDSYIDVVAPESGHYMVSVYDMSGRRVLANDFNALCGQAMRVFPQVDGGMYLLTLEKDGRLAGSCKVLKR